MHFTRAFTIVMMTRRLISIDAQFIATETATCLAIFFLLSFLLFFFFTSLFDVTTPMGGGGPPSTVEKSVTKTV